MNLDYKFQIFGIWSAPAFIVIFTPIIIFMGFFPPHSPLMDAQEVTHAYLENTAAIRLGATAMMQLCLLGVFWVAVITVQIRRMEGDGSRFLTYSQLTLGLLTFFLFLPASIFWSLASFRPDTRAAELTYLLNDLGWVSLLMPVGSAFLQAFVIAAAVFSDKQENPTYPRWFAYLNLWIGFLFFPRMFMMFFKEGPFAWDGLFDFYIPLAGFTLWVLVTSVLTTKAIRK